MENDKKQVNSIKLYRWQFDALVSIRDHWKGSTHVIKAIRQVGKSVFLEQLLLYAAINKPSSESFVVSPTLQQATKIFDELARAISSTPLYLNSNASTKTIYFKNKSKIQFKSTEQGEDALRGYTCTGVMCIDECAYCNDKVIFAILAWRDVHQCPLVCVSTPRAKSGFFYDTFMLGLSGEKNIYSYDWTTYDTSSILPPEKKEFYKKTLPRQLYLTDYEGQFADADSSVFGDFSGVLRNEIDETDTLYWFGIDWSQNVGQDYTAISVFNSSKQQVALHYFNDKNAIETIDFIVKLCEKYDPVKVTVESNSMGRTLYDLLKSKLSQNGVNTPVAPFNTTNESKQKIINGLQVDIQNGEVQLRKDLELELELSVYEYKPSPTGKATFNARQGFHDDCIMATAIALYSLRKGNYSLSIL